MLEFFKNLFSKLFGGKTDIASNNGNSINNIGNNAVNIIGSNNTVKKGQEISVDETNKALVVKDL